MGISGTAFEQIGICIIKHSKSFEVLERDIIAERYYLCHVKSDDFLK